MAKISKGKLSDAPLSSVFGSGKKAIILKWVKENIGFKAIAFVLVIVAVVGAWRVHYNSQDAQLTRLQHANIATLGCHYGEIFNGEQVTNLDSLLEGFVVIDPTAEPPREMTIISIWPFGEVRPDVPLEVIPPPLPDYAGALRSTAKALYLEAVVEAENRRAAEKRRLNALRLECVGLTNTDNGEFSIRLVIERNEDGKNDISITLTEE